MKGYKAFNNDLTCRGFQYAIGEEYTMEDKPIPCNRGFHFCATIADCYNFYAMSENTRICEIEATGDVETDDEVKFCTNKIRIIAEVTEEYLRKANSNKTSSGYLNSGNRNSGNRNSGDLNSGYLNSGNRNSGDWNSGNRNSGDLNSGYLNSGNLNSGDLNSGNRNSGDLNSGNWNSGDWNSGNRNSGVFCTDKNPKIKIFDKETDWTIKDWNNSNARQIMRGCPYTYSDFVYAEDMTEEEKKNHTEHEAIGGYVKTFIATTEAKQSWWDELSDEARAEVMALPNFDAEKFKECTGINVEG